jgi:hypothetical protein
MLLQLKFKLDQFKNCLILETLAILDGVRIKHFKVRTTQGLILTSLVSIGSKEADFLAIFYLTFSPTSLEFSGLPLQSADEFRKIEICDMPNILQKNG